MKKHNVVFKFLFFASIGILCSVLVSVIVLSVQYVMSGKPTYVYSQKTGGWVLYNDFALGWKDADKKFNLLELGDLPLPTGLTYHRSTNTAELYFDKLASPQEKQKLINYFKWLLVIPREDLWVNLSSVDSRLTSPALAQVTLGGDILSADYLMKLVSAYYAAEPAFSREITRIAENLYGRSDFDPCYSYRSWVDSSDAVVVVINDDTVAIKDAKLNVRCEVYKHKKSKSTHVMADTFEDTFDFLLAKYVAPKVQDQVRTNLSFSNLRQIHRCVLLAQWLRTENPGCTKLPIVVRDAERNAGICMDVKELHTRMESAHLFLRERISHNSQGQQRVEYQFRGGIFFSKKRMLPTYEKFDAEKTEAGIRRAFSANGIAKEDVSVFQLDGDVPDDTGEHLWSRYSDGTRKCKLKASQMKRTETVGGFEF